MASGPPWLQYPEVDPVAQVRVLIVDDQLPFQQAARMVVEMTTGFEVVGVAGTGEQAIELCRSLAPDLVLMDVQMPGIGGLEATRQISTPSGPPHVVVMSTHESDDYQVAALDAGAIAFIPKSEFGIDALEDVWRLAFDGSPGKAGSGDTGSAPGCAT